IKEQNLQAPAGRVGMAPSPKDQEFTYTVAAPGRLVTAEEFDNIIVRETATGAIIRVKDVGRAELGSQDYNSFGRLNGKPGVPMPGFSVNTMSMFALGLAIGIVVADAIVVVEAVMHHIEHGLAPKEATQQAMKEVSGAVVGIALILSAVFVPVAFLGGLTGQM